MKTLQAIVTEKSEDTFTAVASTEAEDRQGESIQVGGWQLRNFKDNPILLFMHDHTKPIGKATRVWADKASKKLMFKGMISTATEYGKAAKQLMEEGILKTFSVGFRPLEMEGNSITKAELYEISLVSVPANPEARLLMVKSLEKSGFEKSLIEEMIKQEMPSGMPSKMTAAMKSMKTAMTHMEDMMQMMKADDADYVHPLESRLKSVEQQVQIAVKGLQHLNPRRSKQVTTERLSMVKVIARASDKLLTKQSSDAVTLHKVIKRSSEILIRDLKGDL